MNIQTAHKRYFKFFWFHLFLHVVDTVSYNFYMITQIWNVICFPDCRQESFQMGHCHTVGFHWRETLERDAALKRRETQPKRVKSNFFFYVFFIFQPNVPNMVEKKPIMSFFEKTKSLRSRIVGQICKTNVQKVIFLEKTSLRSRIVGQSCEKKRRCCYIF